MDLDPDENPDLFHVDPEDDYQWKLEVVSRIVTFIELTLGKRGMVVGCVDRSSRNPLAKAAYTGYRDNFGGGGLRIR